ncbi:MAG: DUF615 domain-containing protein [Gammaproteobacteria bacterium]|nr:DUF615 domain-containing protein [Gammaproteobacteria bacterium]MCZ6762009.1 DUF615 domain-containing protein [Gammaproteobacteria bacterium]MCZ6880865.1 DUF615 domain-containing protein [Gammaproteobacteria bacterium]
MSRKPRQPAVTADTPVPSKTALKKQMHELQAVGEQLLDLPAARLGSVPMPDTLREAVMLARKMRQFGALNRQKQYIGKLMRRIDAQPIREALAAIAQEGLAEKHTHKLSENWRDRLLSEGDPALESFLEKYPGSDRQQLRQIIRKHQKASSEIGLTTERKKLYRFLHAVLAAEKQTVSSPRNH